MKTATTSKKRTTARGSPETFRHLLVPTDGTRLSERSVKAAIELAASTHARITALHVIPGYRPPVFVDGVVPELAGYTEAEYKRTTQACAAKMLERIAQRASKAKVECDKVAMTHEVPWKAIIAAAKSRDCDLIVMASHGRRGVEALLLGSETSKVLTHSKTPVLVVR